MSPLDFIIHLRTLAPEEQLAAIEAWREPGPEPITSQAQAATMLATIAAELEHIRLNGYAYFKPFDVDQIDQAARGLENIAQNYQEGNIPMLIHFPSRNVVVTQYGPEQFTVMAHSEDKVVVLNHENVLMDYHPDELLNVFEIGDNIGFTTALTPEQAQAKVDRAIDITFYPDLEPGFYSGMGVKQKKA